MNVTFKQVRAKRIVCTLILCSTCWKFFRVYNGGKSFTIRHVSSSNGSGMSTPSKGVIFTLFFDDAGGGMACPRVWFFLGFDRSATKVWHKFTYEEHISV